MAILAVTNEEAEQEFEGRTRNNEDMKLVSSILSRLAVRDSREGRELAHQVLLQYISQLEECNVEGGGWDDEFVRSLVKLSIVYSDDENNADHLSESSSLDRLITQEIPEKARVKLMKFREVNFSD
eukprot:CAMPEP_0185280890 /NCGR_PEP_ID=MMETSP1359-20130426/66401_1 /TAXON_ID=552665 /ORGANISM="Bigelowiella longifila, Strain CCMP242" /LENGTH=125 /DNA_ID=CAMNT_0027876237 /DNA_START=603 /DNA_END=980 /DNA_ORIENTATION=-